MKRFLFVLATSLASCVITYWLTFYLFASWYGPRYIKNDDDIGETILWLIGVCVLSLILGGFAGNKIYKQRTGQ